MENQWGNPSTNGWWTRVPLWLRKPQNLEKLKRQWNDWNAPNYSQTIIVQLFCMVVWYFATYRCEFPPVRWILLNDGGFTTLWWTDRSIVVNGKTNRPLPKGPYGVILYWLCRQRSFPVNMEVSCILTSIFRFFIGIQPILPIITRALLKAY
jgi:hypothetical protein